MCSINTAIPFVQWVRNRFWSASKNPFTHEKFIFAVIQIVSRTQWLWGFPVAWVLKCFLRKREKIQIPKFCPCSHLEWLWPGRLRRSPRVWWEYPQGLRSACFVPVQVFCFHRGSLQHCIYWIVFSDVIRKNFNQHTCSQKWFWDSNFQKFAQPKARPMKTHHIYKCHLLRRGLMRYDWRSQDGKFE